MDLLSNASFTTTPAQFTTEPVDVSGSYKWGAVVGAVMVALFIVGLSVVLIKAKKGKRTAEQQETQATQSKGRENRRSPGDPWILNERCMSIPESGINSEYNQRDSGISIHNYNWYAPLEEAKDHDDADVLNVPVPSPTNIVSSGSNSNLKSMSDISIDRNNDQRKSIIKSSASYTPDGYVHVSRTVQELVDTNQVQLDGSGGVMAYDISQHKETDGGSFNPGFVDHEQKTLSSIGNVEDSGNSDDQDCLDTRL